MRKLRKLKPYILARFACLFFALGFSQNSLAQDTAFEDYAPKREAQIQAVMLEGGPVFTKHIQSGDDNYRENHGIAIAKLYTKDYGNWALYFLNPNSVDRTSFGAGYVTEPYVLPIMGPVDLELSAALGLVTGYQDFPVPLIAGQARLKLYERGAWDAGITAAANPYVMEEKNTNDTKWGMVVTSPFLSLRYKFD